MSNFPIFSGTSSGYALKEGNDRVADFLEFLERVIDGKAYDNDIQKGIILQALDRGTESLSDKQRWHLEQLVQYYDKECDLCGNQISFCDAWDLDGSYCSSCSHNLRD